ncbi:hypothetical protein [Vibrio vulnificus]|uniref:hypothetical protein n=1 Tax=Vibrio vulnificus TaxID=672 RepID=UPI0007218CFA|nr:hypothetical protein [Vibrio vulnificus]ALM72124.1 hypothetical protein FORC9_2607 [Vibrio vulnificus]ANH62073.1 hypothetical protein FORC16_0190 [Vibrio vulnificus]
MPLIIADTLSEKGHYKFNNEILNWMCKEDIDFISFFSSDFFDNKSENENNLSFSSFFLYKKNMIVYVSFQFLLHLRLLLLSHKNDKKVILLSYEIYSFSIISYLYRLMGVKVLVVEHNTVPNSSSKIKSVFYSLISSHVKHLCLESYISNYVSNEFGKKSAFFQHPILIENEINYTKSKFNNQSYFFMPSSTVEASVADSIIKLFALNPSEHLLMKDIGCIRSKNVEKQKFFEDYYNLLMKADGVILPQDFSYRVSGVFYESLAYVNKVYMTPCIMSVEMKKLYPERVVIIDELSSIFSDKRSEPNKIDIEAYNDYSKSCFIGAINEYF